MSNLDARLGAFAALVGASLDLDRVVDHVVTAVRDLLSTDRVTVWIRDEHTDEIHRLARAATAAEPGSRSRFRVGVGVVGWVVANNAPYYSPNVATDERYADKAEAKSAGYRSVFGVPLSSGDHAIGALTVMTRAEHGFTEEDRRLISLFAVHTATAMEHARLFQHAQQRAQRLAALAAVTRLITSASEPDAVHTAICQAAITLLGAKMVHVWVDGPDRGVLRLASHHGPEASPTLAHGQGVAGRVFETRTPEVIDDIQTQDAWVHKHLIEGLHTCLAWPLVAGDHGRGALMVLFAERRPLTQEERELVDLLAGHAAIAIDREARLAEQRSQSRELALKTQRLEALRRVSLTVASSPTEAAVFTAITAAAV
ncbi:MAG: GAF domain-containing protein, partial [Candidatus Rokubacteria bacterium]|nr:GAF domain-containing protein [Candidatus Rokubacteria bacterium]